jgi:hypothetical protein
MRSRTLLLVLSVLLAVGGAQGNGGNGPEPLRVLFVGNSLTATNDLPAVVSTLAKTFSHSEITYRTIAPGGDLPEPTNHSVYLHAGSGDEALHRVQQALEGHGPYVGFESQVDLRVGDSFADRGAHHVRPALLTVWPETERSYALPAVIRSYRDAARAAHAELYPAGRAWQAAWRRNPRLPLYGADGFHPSQLGTYLTALVVLAGLTHEPPINRPFRINGRASG